MLKLLIFVLVTLGLYVLADRNITTGGLAFLLWIGLIVWAVGLEAAGRGLMALIRDV